MPNSVAKSKIGCVLKGKCPRCRSGNVFQFPSSKIAKFNKMHTDCPVCGLHFELEPGYFYTAMYISYAISSAFTLMLGLLTYKLLHDPELWVYTAVIITTLLLFSPISLRFSRMLALVYVSPIKFDKKYQTKESK